MIPVMIQILTGIQNTAAALDAEHTRLEVISQNIANAHTTHDMDGKPYQRQWWCLSRRCKTRVNGEPASGNLPAIQVAKIERDTRPPMQVYDPGNPKPMRTEWFPCPT